MRSFVQTQFRPITDNHVKELARLSNAPVYTIRKQLEDEEKTCTVWVNDKYQVLRREFTGAANMPMVQLNIRRRDGKPIFRDWREFQQIKNELCGEEFEAVELYPAESRLVDTSNKYHLWVVMLPGWRWPFGFHDRDVRGRDNGAVAPGMKQRAFPRVTP